LIPEVPTLIAAEFPILAVDATLALTSFTLVGPLGLAWWLPIVALAAIGSASTGRRTRSPPLERCRSDAGQHCSIALIGPGAPSATISIGAQSPRPIRSRPSACQSS
jgi:hypothetical protein